MENNKRKIRLQVLFHHPQKINRGFTLVEILVVVFIFALVMLIASAILVSAVRAQRYNLAYQELLDQTSYVMEYMSRALRMAKQDESGGCIGGTFTKNETYGTDGDNIKFLNQDGDCTEFFLDGGQLKKDDDTVETPTPIALTATPHLNVTDFDINLIPSGGQPMVQISLLIGGGEGTSIKIQTSVSQRDLNY